MHSIRTATRRQRHSVLHTQSSKYTVYSKALLVKAVQISPLYHYSVTTDPETQNTWQTPVITNDLCGSLNKNASHRPIGRALLGGVALLEKMWLCLFLLPMEQDVELSTPSPAPCLSAS